MKARAFALSPAERAWLATIVTVGAVLRIILNDVRSYSSADEAVYVDLTRRLARDGFLTGYAAVARDWLNDPSWWRYPSPLRCGYFTLATFATRLLDRTDARALAWLSTIAGIAVVPLLFAVARRLADTRTALLAAAFAAVSPIGLALGRRALQDEVLCAATLVAFLAVLLLLEDDEAKPLPRMALAIAALTFALSVKETLLLLFPALAAFVVLYRRPRVRHLALFAAPPLLWWGLLAALARDATMPFRTARRVAASMAAPYVVQYQSGPPHRVLFDFVIVAPLIAVLACGAVVLVAANARTDRGIRALAAVVVLGMAAFAVVASKNLRFTSVLDPFLRLLGAWIVVMPRDGIPSRASTIVAVAAANAAIELELFRRIFLLGQVYDPVTHAMLDALGAVPRNAAAPPAPMLWPWICAAIAGAVWLRGHHERS